MRWRDVDLGTGTLYVRDSKTLKGVRDVHLTPALRETLVLWKADANYTSADAYVIQTSTGRKQNPSNLRRDVLSKAVEAANVKLDQLGIAPIGRLTFHGLRRTYASLRCVCGDDIRYTADQLGHEDARFTMRCYARDQSVATGWLSRTVRPSTRRLNGAATNRSRFRHRPARSRRRQETRLSGAFRERMMGLEPTTFCMATARKRAR